MKLREVDLLFYGQSTVDLRRRSPACSEMYSHIATVQVTFSVVLL